MVSYASTAEPTLQMLSMPSASRATISSPTRASAMSLASLGVMRLPNGVCLVFAHVSPFIRCPLFSRLAAQAHINGSFKRRLAPSVDNVGDVGRRRHLIAALEPNAEGIRDRTHRVIGQHQPEHGNHAFQSLRLLAVNSQGLEALLQHHRQRFLPIAVSAEAQGA